MLAQVVKALLPLPVLEQVVGRKRQAFALGPPKSGTTSIAGIFRSVCRADHESHRPRTVAEMHAHFNEQMTDQQLMQSYRDRDKRLLLDLESNCFLAYRPDLLRDTFPDASYIIAVREPRQWLDSIFDNNINFPRDKNLTMQQWHAVLFHSNREPRTENCEKLQERRLYPVDCYLAYWARTYDRCIRALANSRHLIVGTNQISSRMNEIGEFIGIDVSLVDRQASHRNRTSERHGILADLDPEYIEKSMETFCQPVIEEHGLAALWD